ncbi:MAG TPA: hypothetical protein VM012_07070 [Flavitalea sp.]|nr:hypothetical protein [Flavitalea sp.]
MRNTSRIVCLPVVTHLRQSFVTNLSRRNVTLVIYSSPNQQGAAAIERRAKLFIMKNNWKKVI